MNLPDLRKSQMKLTARQKYDYRDLDRGERNLGMPSGEIAANWAIRSPKERALRRHSRAFGRRRGNIGRELAKNRDLRFLKYRDAHKQIFNVNVSFRLETVRLEFQPSGSQ
jgi:hypothetical protein